MNGLKQLSKKSSIASKKITHTSQIANNNWPVHVCSFDQLQEYKIILLDCIQPRQTAEIVITLKTKSFSFMHQTFQHLNYSHHGSNLSVLERKDTGLCPIPWKATSYICITVSNSSSKQSSLMFKRRDTKHTSSKLTDNLR